MKRTTIPKHSTVVSKALEANNITVQYGQSMVLKGLSFSVQTGEMVGILGPNGSGKTTLLHALLGLVPLQSGQVKLLGADLTAIGSKERARLAGMVPQKLGTPFPFKVYEVVLMGRYPHISYWRGYKGEDHLLAAKALEHTGLEHLSGRLFPSLSGGEQQMSLLARLQAQNPKIFLLDEATSALDIRRKIEALDFITKLSLSKNLTVLAVFHDINLAALYCSRLMFLKSGEIRYDGMVKEVLTPDKIRDIFETKVIVTRHPSIDAPQVFFMPGG